MKKFIVILLAFSMIILSCEKNNEVKVTYQTTQATSEYFLHYLNESGTLSQIKIVPQSAQDIWKYEFVAEQGNIVYVSGNYNDANSALKIMILVNGKVYKQASNMGDTLMFLTVSGVVPICN